MPSSKRKAQNTPSTSISTLSDDKAKAGFIVQKGILVISPKKLISTEVQRNDVHFSREERKPSKVIEFNSSEMKSPFLDEKEMEKIKKRSTNN